VISKKIVAIHQPNFFPWLGYFDKISRSDVFVFLNDVQFQKTGGTWTNRVKLLVNGQAAWITAAIDRNFSGTKTINQMSFLDGNPWREKFVKNLATNYRRHPFFKETMAILEDLILNPEQNISEYNTNAILKMCGYFGWDLGKFYMSSEFNFSSHSNELLCDLTMAVDGDTYMCGGGAEGYHVSAIFAEKQVALLHQNFQHPQYEQRNSETFVPGLSIIDALMNLGRKGTIDLIQCTQAPK
jgi:hypothetical protein